MLTPILAVAILTALPHPTCETALAAAPAYAFCAQGENGVALSGEQAEADALLVYSESAEPRFAKHFAKQLKPYVVLYFEETAPVAELQGAGFPTVLAWASPQKIGRLLGETLRQNARGTENTPPSPADEAAIEAQVALLTRGIIDMQDGVVSHEVAHLWYRDAYWQGSDLPGDGYGTPAPDWLDETAAILCENDALADQRRRKFLEAWTARTAEDRHTPEAVGDLAHLLNRRHPSKMTPPRPQGADGAGPVVTVRPSSGDRELYYAQVKMFADFLIDATGDEQVFAHVTNALVTGRSLEHWLSAQSNYAGLARDVPGLQRQWAEWIEGQITETPVASEVPSTR